MGICAHRQTQQRRGILECPAPVGEVIRSSWVAGPPRSDVDIELIQTRIASVVHGLEQLVVLHQIPVFRKTIAAVGSRTGSRRCPTGRGRRFRRAATRRGTPSCRIPRSPGRAPTDAAADWPPGERRPPSWRIPRALRRRSARFRPGSARNPRTGIEHAQGDIGARSDVFEESQHAFAAVHFHHRRL